MTEMSAESNIGLLKYNNRVVFLVENFYNFGHGKCFRVSILLSFKSFIIMQRGIIFHFYLIYFPITTFVRR